MNLQDLYNKHHTDIENFKILKTKVWEELLEKHKWLTENFGKDNIPEDYSKNMENEKLDYHSTWGIPDGAKYKNIVQQHKEQISAVTDFLNPIHDQAKAHISDNIVEKKQRSFMDKLTGSRVLQEEQEKSKDNIPEINKGKDYQQNKDDMDLEID